MHFPHFSYFRDGEVFHERYRVLRCLNVGGMGAVYEVVDEKTDTRRALKVLLPAALEDADLRSRFGREARVTGALESDHIVQVSDAGLDKPTGMPFLVMELLRGEDLGSLLKKRAPLPREEVLLYLAQVALALDKTHAAGIVHRDLKPENLFVSTRDDGSPRIKLLDFGLAKVVSSPAQRSTKPMGTPLFMAPEQVLGDLGPPADIYALGHLTYMMLVGEAYWREEAERMATISDFVVVMACGAREPPFERAARRRGVALPAAFDDWFFTATALRPKDRFAGAGLAVMSLADALGADRSAVLLATQPERGSSSPAAEVTPLFLTRTLALHEPRRVLPAAAALSLLAIGALIFTMKSTSTERPPRVLEWPKPLVAPQQADVSENSAPPPPEEAAQQEKTEAERPRLPAPKRSARTLRNDPRHSLPGIY